MQEVISPKVISRLNWMMIVQNPISLRTVLFFAGIEGLIAILYSLSLQQRLINSLSTNEELGREYSNEEIELSLSFVTKIDGYARQISSQALEISTILIAAFLTSILLVILIMLIKEKAQQINNSNFTKQTSYQVLGTVILAFSKMLYVPVLDIILSNTIYSQQNMNNDSTSIVYLVLSIYSLFLYLIVLFYGRCLFKLNMMSGDDLAIWSLTDSKLIYMEFISKIITPCILQFDKDGLYIQYELIIIFLYQVFFLLFCLMFAAPFKKPLFQLKLVYHSVMVFILEIGLLKQLLRNRDNKEGIIFLFFLGFNIYSIIQLRMWRESKLIQMFKKNLLSKQSEYEQVFVFLIDLAHDCINELQKGSALQQQYMAKLSKAIESHLYSCSNTNCACIDYENLTEMFRASYQVGQGQILLSQQKLKKVYEMIFAEERFSKLNTNITKMLSSSVGGLQNNNLNLDSDSYQLQAINSEEDSEFDGDEKDDQHEEGNNLSLNSIRLNDGSESQRTHQRRQLEKTFLVDQMEAKKFYILTFIKIFLDEIKSKHPDSPFIINAYNYFSLFLLNKPQLALLSLRKSQQANKNHSWVDKVSACINENYILYHYELFLSSSSSHKLHKIDAEQLIQVNSLYQKFHIDIEDLSVNTIQFWKGFTFDELDPFSQIKIGEKISGEIKELYNKFLQIEKILTQKDPKLYLWFALVQLKIMNDQEGYQIFVAKTKEIQQMRKLIKLDIKLKDFDHESGFVLVDGKAQSQGTVLMMNKVLRRLLGREEDELKFLNINCMMPSLIEASHEKFMDEYNRTGQSKMMNKKVVHFVKDKSSYLIPVEALIKFHYSSLFNYCFVGVFEQVKQMRPFRDDISYAVNKLIVLAINWENGQIAEASQNFPTLIKKCGINSITSVGGMIFQEKVITIEDIFDGLNFKQIKAIRRKAISAQKNFHEGIYKLDLFEFNDEIDNRKQFQNMRKSILAKVAIYKEVYGEKGNIKIGYVILTLDIGANDIMRTTLNLDNLEERSFKQQNGSDQIIMNQIEEQNNEDDGSSVGSSNSSSSRVSSFDVKSFHSFYQQSTPRMLKIVLQMVLLLFISSITISSVNLGLSIKNQIQQTFEIKTVKAASDRINLTINNRIIIRVLLNIANGYEPNTSNLIENRTKTYLEIQKDRIVALQETQQYLDNSGYPFKSDFLTIINSPDLALLYLNNNNSIYTELATLKVAQNLFTTRLLQINGFSRNQLKGNLRIQSLSPNESSKYQPSQQEQSIYFAVINGNGVIRQYNVLFLTNYISETKTNTDDRKTSAVILTVVSVLTILIVALVISPIISQTEERKYKALSFFLKIPRDKIAYYVQRCEDCLKLEEESSNMKPQEENQSDAELDENNVHKRKENMQNFDSNKRQKPYRERNELDISQFDDNSFISLYNNEEFNSSQQANLNLSLRQEQLSSLRNLKGESARVELFSKIMHDKQESERPQASENIDKKYLIEEASFSQKNAQGSQIQEEDEDQSEKSLEVIADIERKRKTTANYTTDNRMMGTKHKKLEDIKIPVASFTEDQINLKEDIIKRIGFRQKVKSFVAIISLTLTCSLYFLATFWISMKNYALAYQAIDDLVLVLQKGSCFENTFNFLRENQIRNQSIIMVEDNISVASSFYLKTCYEKESQYWNLRKNLPIYFSDAEGLIQNLEQNTFCDNIYAQSNGYTQYLPLCKKALNGLLGQGLSNAMASWYQKAQKMQLEFDSLQSTKNSTLTNLRVALNDTEAIEIIDTKVYVLNYAFQLLKDISSNSLINYFQSQLDVLIIIYVIFICLILTSMIIFFFYSLKRLRRTMWNTNLMLKIIPQDDIPKQEQEKIRSFFIN